MVEQKDLGCGKMFHFDDKELGILHLKCGVWVLVNKIGNHQKMEYCEKCRWDENEDAVHGRGEKDE